MTPDTDDRSALLERSLVEVAIETWRLSRLFARVVTKLDAGDQGRYTSQLRFFQKKVDEHLEAIGYKLVSLEGQPFDAGLAASAVNIADFDADEKLLVDQMVEPIVMSPEGLKRQGTVILRKAHV